MTTPKLILWMVLLACILLLALVGLFSVSAAELPARLWFPVVVSGDVLQAPALTSWGNGAETCEVVVASHADAQAGSVTVADCIEWGTACPMGIVVDVPLVADSRGGYTTLWRGYFTVPQLAPYAVVGGELDGTEIDGVPSKSIILECVEE